MRITVVSSGDVSNDPAALPLVHSLATADHELSIVARAGDSVGNFEVTRTRRSSTRSRKTRDEDMSTVLGKTVARTKPDVIHPLRQRDVAAAVASKRGLIARNVDWQVPSDRDLISLAPHHPELVQPERPESHDYFVRRSEDAGHTPAPDRHQGRTVAVLYRHTATSPGRYLEAALERSGARVIRFDGTMSWDEVPKDAAALVIVESPYPEMRIEGSNPGVPVLFWVHHGEHHLDANLRLTQRYGADAILLAHSWHLAYRFPTPVHRFPFAVPTELYGPEPPSFDERSVDVAMVGAGVDRQSPRYADRYLRISDLRQEFGGRALFRADVPPEAMAALYANAKVVINDGGIRHLPITMRVFEAVGAGSLLATDPLPGTDILFAPNEHYIELGWTVPAHLREVLADPATPRKAAAAHRHALGHHTYDHRVDVLLHIADATDHVERVPPRASDPLDQIIASDVEVSTLATFGDVAVSLPDINVRNGVEWLEAGGTGRFDAAVIADGEADLAAVAASVRRYVYVVGRDEDEVLAEVRELSSKATASTLGDITRVDIGAPGYVVRNGVAS